MDPKAWPTSGQNVCRCCLAEGCYKDISTEYFWMGKREVYSDMLNETFDVNISFSKSGSTNSRLICEPCISRLRDASEFKKQVVDCERMFMNHLSEPGSSTMAEPLSTLTPDDVKVIKVEAVKQEKDSDGDEDFADTTDFLDDDDDDEDDLDNQPLTKFATKVPKKEAVDIMDLLDNTELTIKRKAPTKTKAVPAKKAKTTTKVTAKATVSKAKTAQRPKTAAATKAVVEKKKKGMHPPTTILGDRNSLTEQTKIRKNGEMVLKNSNAIPFKTRHNNILCSMCCDVLENMAALRNHMTVSHPELDIDSIYYKLKEPLKLDISMLKCNICSQTMIDLDTFINHLSTDHETNIHTDVPLELFAFKENMETGEWICVYCNKILATFTAFNRHIPEHFKKFYCDKCGSGFVTSLALKTHCRLVKCHSKVNYEPRDKIAKPRSNARLVLQTFAVTPFRMWNKNFSCVFCRVQAIDPLSLRQHMILKHASYDSGAAFYKRLGREFIMIDITELRCKVCLADLEFDEVIPHLIGHKKPILQDAQLGVLPFKLGDGTKWVCVVCTNEFSDFESLSKHTSGHFQNYVCDTCGEGFITETALIAHTKIPHDNKFNCNRCVATFTTAEERKQHVKERHPSNPYVCLYCKEKPRFASSNQRKKHLIEFHNYTHNVVIECTTCQKTFKTRSAKWNHMERVHRNKRDSERQFPCGNCAKAFSTKANLETHMLKKHYENM